LRAIVLAISFMHQCMHTIELREWF